MSMEFREKLRFLRKEKGFTQEELAEKLCVSRTAVSKWESGRGLPSIESLRDIASLFSLSIDELISGENIVKIARKNMTDVFCGALDSLSVLMLLLPIFGQKIGGTVFSVSVFDLTEISLWQKALFVILPLILFFEGVILLLLSAVKKTNYCEIPVMAGLAVSAVAALLFIISRQPYAASFCFFILVIKGFLLIKKK